MAHEDSVNWVHKELAADRGANRSTLWNTDVEITIREGGIILYKGDAEECSSHTELGRSVFWEIFL